jgi:hypothetical protein
MVRADFPTPDEKGCQGQLELGVSRKSWSRRGGLCTYWTDAYMQHEPQGDSKRSATAEDNLVVGVAIARLRRLHPQRQLGSRRTSTTDNNELVLP